MKYRLIQLIEGQWCRSEFTDDNLLPAMEARGFALNGFNRNKGNREELQGQPKFTGVLGPMWDGDAVRYESREAYNQLSA
jgi:hypothetical protein